MASWPSLIGARGAVSQGEAWVTVKEFSFPLPAWRSILGLTGSEHEQLAQGRAVGVQLLALWV